MVGKCCLITNRYYILHGSILHYQLRCHRSSSALLHVRRGAPDSSSWRFCDWEATNRSVSHSEALSESSTSKTIAFLWGSEIRITGTKLAHFFGFSLKGHSFTLTENQFCFHRPLHELFAPFFRVGLVMDALEEVNFDESFRDPLRDYAARNYAQFPKILAFRMRSASLNDWSCFAWAACSCAYAFTLLEWGFILIWIT